MRGGEDVEGDGKQLKKEAGSTANDGQESKSNMCIDMQTQIQGLSVYGKGMVDRKSRIGYITKGKYTLIDRNLVTDTVEQYQVLGGLLPRQLERLEEISEHGNLFKEVGYQRGNMERVYEAKGRKRWGEKDKGVRGGAQWVARVVYGIDDVGPTLQDGHGSGIWTQLSTVDKGIFKSGSKPRTFGAAVFSSVIYSAYTFSGTGSRPWVFVYSSKNVEKVFCKANTKENEGARNNIVQHRVV
ncbi:hypothetical protein AX774_g151 [Zancudomyces culisetae]|uniref:Uncharacterized protein n=1 Tax=Zancudomyces culisetae TaxID=1213189 RepID=A0A1R1PZ81_ZANCU|nr:hypothetical protein AX774_g151 [Zancudomyces culisetae]|eukprot:OMH86260.1 hypothetical protein AX774_g151 [Zancudomyces culisetae]